MKKRIKPEKLFWEKAHARILAAVSDLEQALLYLRLEGKPKLRKNLSSVERQLGFFRKHLNSLLEVEEKKIYPFICRHMPKLTLAAHFLEGEHAECLTALQRLELLTEKFLQTKNGHSAADHSNVLWTSILEEGSFFVCFLRNHLDFERKLLLKRVKSFSDQEKVLFEASVHEAFDHKPNLRALVCEPELQSKSA